MKNILLSLVLISSLFFVSPTKAYAISTKDVQDMISAAIAPLQTAITGLQNSVTDLLTRVTALESNFTADFNLPSSWNSSFNFTNYAIALSPPKTSGAGCSWNGISIRQPVQVRATAHLVNGNVFGVGTCDLINFTNITPADFPSPGSSFLVDLDLFWQGKLKHQQLSLTVPQPTPTATP